MEQEERQKLEELKSHVHCIKNFSCVSNKFKTMCRAAFILDKNDLECLEKGSIPCDFAVTQGERKVCSCDLRIYIEKNLDNWIEKSTTY